MDTSERYDPEDIESLLRERSFDELLEEERAYVLRHLSGRQEYEDMRLLMRHMQDAEDDRSPIEADERVRSQVMDAFRKQRTPVWRIWLNALGSLFPMPAAPVQWRPALALATLLLIVVSGALVVWSLRDGPGRVQVAEMEPGKTPQQKELNESPVPASEVAEEQAAQEEEERKGSLAAVRDVDAMDAEPVTNEQRSRMEMADEVAVDVDALAEVREERSAGHTAYSITEDEVDTRPAAPAMGSSRVVTAEELMRNQSIAEVSSFEKPHAAKVKASADKGGGKGRSLAEDATLMDLLVKAW
jgi:hypothetical protein